MWRYTRWIFLRQMLANIRRKAEVSSAVCPNGTAIYVSHVIQHYFQPFHGKLEYTLEASNDLHPFVFGSHLQQVFYGIGQATQSRLAAVNRCSWDVS